MVSMSLNTQPVGEESTGLRNKSELQELIQNAILASVPVTALKSLENRKMCPRAP